MSVSFSPLRTILLPRLSTPSPVFKSPLRSLKPPTTPLRRGYTTLPPPPPPPPPPRARSAFRKWTVRLALILAFPAVYFTGAIFPPKVVMLLYPRYSPPPPDAKSSQGKALMSETEKELQNLYIVARLRTKGDQYYETREFCLYLLHQVRRRCEGGQRPAKGRG